MEERCIPVTDDTDQDLTHNDTDDLEVVDGVQPLCIANFVILPTRLEGSLEEGLDVSDGEEHVTRALMG